MREAFHRVCDVLQVDGNIQGSADRACRWRTDPERLCIGVPAALGAGQQRRNALALRIQGKSEPA
jgi:hypothetical protein